MKFTKMQGIGNDYVYVNCFEEVIAAPAATAIAVSDRHFGIGADGLILICPSETADCRMRMFNADGSEGEMCGNGIRCVGKYVYDRDIAKKNPLTVETRAGIKTLYLELEQDVVRSVRVNMGKPSVSEVLTLQAADRSFQVTPVSMGNPHGVIRIGEAVASYPVQTYGRILEKHAAFPQGANIEFTEVLSRHEVNMRVWERGSGETLACGTGACACAAAGIAAGILDSEVTVHLLGGDLRISLEADGCIYMTGPAQIVFDGVWERT